MSQTFSLSIANIQLETADTKTIFLEIPSNLSDEFIFDPGQYLTVLATINGEEVRRSYSISTIPNQATIGITVKKLQGGLMSSHLHDNINVNDQLVVMAPDGRFVVKTKHDISRDHYFFAAGSGITPIMSMIRTILEEEPRSTCYLLYGSRDEDNIIFQSQLDDMVAKYGDQLYVEYMLSQPKPKKAGGIAGLFGKKTTDWSGSKGRVDARKCIQFLYDFPGRHNDRHYYICGPGDFIKQIDTFLIGQEIDKKNIHKEYFSTPKEESGATSNSTTAVAGQVKVILRGETIMVDVPAKQTILEALVKLKADPPYSCTSGACSTCIAKVTKGTVTMDTCYALDDDEIEAGYILTCQAHPTSGDVELTYDV